MAVTLTRVATSSGIGTTLNTTSFTCLAGKYYLFVFYNNVGTTSGYPLTVTKNGGTLPFSLIAQTGAGTSTAPVCGMYGGYCTADGTGTVTSTWSSTSNTRTRVFEVEGVTATGAIVQSAVGNNTTGTNPSCTLAAFSAPTNSVFFIAASSTNTTHTPDAGFTRVDDDGGVPNNQYSSYEGGSSDTTTSITLGTSSAWAMTAVEFQAVVVDDSGDEPPTTVVTNGSTGFPWSNPGNAITSDNTYATQVSADASVGSSDFLRATGFNFSIPGTATVSGITAKIERSYTGGTRGQIQEDNIQLLKAGTAVGTNKGSAVWTTTDTFTTVGGQTDLWGTTWSPSDINNADFGVQVRVANFPDFASTGNTNPSANTTEAGSGGLNWVNPGNVYTANNTRATCTAPGASSNVATIFPFINVTGFGFSVPSDATITGVTCGIDRSRSGGSTGEIRFNTVQLIVGGARSGTAKSSATNFPTTEAYQTFGANNNLWGASLTPTNVNASNFGISVRLIGSTATTNRVGNIDHIRVNVAYALPGDRTARVDSITLRVHCQDVVFFSTTGAQTGAYSAALGRLRPVAAAVAESITVSAAIDVQAAILDLACSISQSIAVSPQLNRNRALSTTIAESLTFLAEIVRTRTISTTIAETETVTSVLKVQRALSSAISEAIDVAALLRRTRNVSVSDAQTLNVSTDVQIFALITLAAQISMANELSVAVNVNRSMAADIDQFIDLTSALSRNRQVMAQIAESTVLSALLVKSIHLVTAIVESNALQVSLNRERKIAASDSQVLDLVAAFARLKELSTAISEDLTVTVDVLERLRGVSAAVSLLSTVSAAIQRARGFGTIIQQNNVVTANIRRLRELVSSIIQAQGVTANTVSRIRGLVTDIALATNITVSLRVTGTEPGEFQLTMTWFENVSDGNSAFNQVERTQTWTVRRTAATSEFAIQVPPTIVITCDDTAQVPFEVLNALAAVFEIPEARIDP